PTTFRVEGATGELPDAARLWNALITETIGDQVRLSLDVPSLASLSSTDTAAYVADLDIKYQIWAWNGKPAETDDCSLPALADAGTEDKLAKWDGIGFHNRSDYQHRLKKFRLQYQEVAGRRPVSLDTDERSGDLRA